MASPSPVPAAITTHVASRTGTPSIEHCQIGRRQHTHTERGRFEVVQNSHAAKPEKRRHRGAIHDPRHIRPVNAVVHHWAGHPERGRGYARRILLQKILGTFPAGRRVRGWNSACARHATSLPMLTSNRPIFDFVPPISPARIIKIPKRASDGRSRFKITVIKRQSSAN